MKIKGIIILALAICLLTACASSGGEYTTVKADDSGTVTIPAQDITEQARFYNYAVDGVTVQLVALRDEDGDAHIAFNTCQNCSPSPKAFYSQNGDVLQCNNCGFTFEPDEVGITHGGCNPWPIEGVKISNSEIVVPVSSIEGMKKPFSTWHGLVK